jgi:hypothetical protein
VKSRASRAYAELREDLALSGYAASNADGRQTTTRSSSNASPREETERP